MTGTLFMRRSRGAASGILLVLLGLWGGVIPFVGPYFRYAYTPDTTWTYTTGRLWLEILPAAAVFVAGVLLISAAARPIALAAGFLGAAAGAWFALGPVLSPLWNHGTALGGVPAGTTTAMRIVEQIGFFTGLGIAIVFIAALAIGRIASLPAEPVRVAPATSPAETEPVA